VKKLFTDLDKILHTHPHMSKKGFGAGLIPPTPPSEPGGLKPLKLKNTILKTFAKKKDIQHLVN